MSVKIAEVADEFRELGNELFKKSNFKEALIAFNQSLSFAPPNSSQLGLAYANRSAVYLEMKQFDLCLDNIRLARGNKYQNEDKLRQREQRCIDMKNNSDLDPLLEKEEFFKLSYPANENIPFIVNCIELRQNQEFGLHIVATKDLNPGDIIGIEDIFFPSINMVARWALCTYCLKSNIHSLIPCDGCPNAMFCDQECLNKAKERFHFAECKRGPYRPQINSSLLRDILITRRILESLYIAGSVGSFCDLMRYADADRKTIFDFDLRGQDELSRDKMYLEILPSLQEKRVSSGMANHYREFENSTIEQLQPFLVQKYGSDFDDDDLAECVTHLMLINDRNSSNLMTGRPDKLVGTGMFMFGSLLNHSCDPNLHVVYLDSKYVYVVINPINKGEQLFVQYTPTYHIDDCVIRQMKLKDVYGFTCSCAACENDYRMSSLPVRDPNFEDSFASPTSFKEAVKEFKQRCDYLKKMFKYHPSKETARTQMILIQILLQLVLPFSDW